MDFVAAMPLFPVTLAFGLVVVVLAVRPVSVRLDLPVWLVLGLLASVCLILAATLSPGTGGSWGACLSDIALPLGPRGLLVMDERALNVWLFVPLGVFSALAARRHPWILLAALVVTLVVEATQRFAPVLGRRCQFQDLVDNTWGLVLGACVGLLIGALTRSPRGS